MLIVQGGEDLLLDIVGLFRRATRGGIIMPILMQDMARRREPMFDLKNQKPGHHQVAGGDALARHPIGITLPEDSRRNRDHDRMSRAIAVTFRLEA